MSLPADGVNANALTETTTIPTGKKLIFLDPDTNEGGIITLENLTKQILSNLATQTFNLDQGTKTLLAALNELNSNLYLLLIIKRLLEIFLTVFLTLTSYRLRIFNTLPELKHLMGFLMRVPARDFLI